jgi:hypothetical protein
MADNSQKTPLALALPQVAEARVRAAIALEGKALPAIVTAVRSGYPIVTVGFLLTNVSYTLPRVTVPVASPVYIRLPIQVNDLGVVMPIDTYLGGVSGLGGGVADLSQRANLSTLAFFPVGNAGWAAANDPNALILVGPDGVQLGAVGDAKGPGVARIGDAVDTPAGIGTIIGGSTKVFAS